MRAVLDAILTEPWNSDPDAYRSSAGTIGGADLWPVG